MQNTKAQCSECCNDKFYLNVDTDVASCTECGKDYPPEKSIRERVADILKDVREEAEAKFLMHEGDF